MTDKFTELSAREPIFGQVRNLMDLCVAAALIEKEELVAQASCDLGLLADANSPLTIEKWEVPKTVATESSFVKTAKGVLITASGGVQIESWEVAANTEVVNQIKHQRETAAAHVGSSWRWD